MVMRCRKLVRNEDGFDVVWFNSAGMNVSKRKINDENFAIEQQYVADDLTQKLLVLKNELWYAIQYGVPLFDKIKSKIKMDSFVASTIMSQPDVIKILKFNSSLNNGVYCVDVSILSSFGNISVEVNV